MFLGKVIGNIWATQKDAALNSCKLMLVQPLNGKHVYTGDPIIAVDTIGAGPGEVVYYITSSESVIPMDVDMAPVDASIVGIVDFINVD